MSARSSKRRSPGEGGCWPYKTKAGERYRVAGPVQMPDGTTGTARKRGFLTKTEGLEWLKEQQVAGKKHEYLKPSKKTLGDYGAEVIDGMRLKPQTRASYVKNWRLHVQAYPIGSIPLAQLTGDALTSHYRRLEKSGRKDHRAGEGLSARTTRYIHTIIHAVLKQAIKSRLLSHNPADAATPPSAREAKAPEMHPWTAGQLAAFLRWADGELANFVLWTVLAMTGMRRGEALSLRWRDIDFDAGCIRLRRSAGMVRYAGAGAEMVEDHPKSSKPRVIDLDPDTVAVLRAWRKARGLLALLLAREDALVFGDVEGNLRNGEHVWRQFKRDIERCRKALGLSDDELPMIRLHDLRHTHATLLLLAREPVHVVSQRLGHSSPVVTMGIYAHVLPGNQLEAANTFARLIREASA